MNAKKDVAYQVKFLSGCKAYCKKYAGKKSRRIGKAQAKEV